MKQITVLYVYRRVLSENGTQMTPRPWADSKKHSLSTAGNKLPRQTK